MNTTMHDLLTSAVEGRERSLTGSDAFADGHAAPLRRSIRARRVATYAGTGTVATLAAISAGYGVHTWIASPTLLTPASGSSDDGTAAESLATQVNTALIPIPYDYSIYDPRENDWIYVYYASVGATDTIPFPGSGLWYPGISDVPSDSLIVALHGNPDGYDLVAQGMEGDIGAFPSWNVPGDGAIGGDLTGDTWDVIGVVSSTTRWGIHYFLLDGNIVTEVDGRSNPNAIEVTAMFDPAAFIPAMGDAASSN